MKKLLLVFKDAAIRLNQNDPLRLSGATAFFSVFAIPPIVIILSSIVRLFDPDFTKTLISKMESIVGADAVPSLKSYQENLSLEDSSLTYTIISIVLFVFISTNLLRIVQQSLNDLYAIEEKKKGFVTNLIERAMGFAFILFTGLLFLITILVDTLLAYVSSHIDVQDVFPTALLKAGSLAASFCFVFLWFAVIIKFLPALRIHWKAICAGGFVTSVLFIAGKYVLNLAVLGVRIKTIYETSTSAVLLLIFIFFISLTIYYGACFSISFATHYGLSVTPKRFAFYSKGRQQEAVA